MKKILIGLIIVLLVLAGGSYLLYQSGSRDNSSAVVVVVDSADKDANSANGNVKTFVLTGENFKFFMDGVENPELRVKEGDKVMIKFTSTSGFHDWKLDDFNAATEKVNDGGSTSVEFIANKRGTFEYYCSVGQHRAQGMKGSLIIE